MALPIHSYLQADQFVISAGCILLKPHIREPAIQAPRLPKDYSLVYIRKRESGDKVLAKGRKDTNESIDTAAIRESFEETGYRCHIVELPTPSLAPGTKEVVLNKESIAITFKVDRLSRDDRVPVQKLIFWWVGEIDMDAEGKPLERTEGTQLPYEDYEVCEMGLEEATLKDGLTFEADRSMLELTISLLLERHRLFLAKSQTARLGMGESA